MLCGESLTLVFWFEALTIWWSPWILGWFCNKATKTLPHGGYYFSSMLTIWALSSFSYAKKLGQILYWHRNPLAPPRIAVGFMAEAAAAKPASYCATGPARQIQVGALPTLGNCLFAVLLNSAAFLTYCVFGLRCDKSWCLALKMPWCCR